MKTHMQLGNYLLAYLHKIGASHLFGIPGDLVIQLSMKFGKPHNIALVEKMGTPCMTTVLEKGAFPMDHSQYMGVHIGAISPASIRQRIA